MARAKLELPDRVLFTAVIAVRISDINYGGHLGNDSLLSLLHEARVQFLRHYGFSEHDIGGKGIIMTDAVLMYKTEIFYGDSLSIEIGITDAHTRGADITYRVMKNGTEAARAKTGIVFFDYEHRTIVSMPEEFKSLAAPTT